jgi:two-component system, cell cycle response regulator
MTPAPTRTVRAAVAARSRWPLGLATLLLAVYWARSLTAFGGAGTDSFFSGWVYTAIMVLAALACAVRARESRAWGVIALGLAATAVGDAIYASQSDLANVPTPSISDPFWLAFYPCAYISLLMLVRSRVSITLSATRLDGLISGFTAASVLACTTLPTAFANTQGDPFWTEATNLAYPVCDLILFGAIVSVAAFSGWRLDRTLVILGAAILAWELADVLYLFNADGMVGNVADATVLTGAVGIAWAAQLDRRPTLVRPETNAGLFAPVGFGLVAVGLLVVGNILHLTPAGLSLAAVALALVLARMGLALAQNRALLSESRVEALNDPLTGLANRRQLKVDLEHLTDGASTRDSYAVVLLDLNGFKSYNDTFGHAAGDALLTQLGASLRQAVRGHGEAYRMGGDEFCVLGPCAPDDAEVFAAQCGTALVTHGDGFSIDAAYGVAVLPSEAEDATQALALADARMYGNKAHRGRPTAAAQLASVLGAVLAERAPAVAAGGRVVSELVTPTAERLGIAGDELDALRHAAALHDLGMMAIPESILTRPDPLDASEWALIRQHPLIGERILSAAPPLERSARLVRASHERLDGSGYPDGLRGDDIPLAARILHAADAFVAMTSARPYGRTRTRDAALTELRRCAGTDFDPDVVAALESVLAEAEAQTSHAEAHPVAPAA